MPRPSDDCQSESRGARDAARLACYIITRYRGGMGRSAFNLLHLGLAARLALAAVLIAVVWGATIWALA